jgi:Tol biopolymer transport system component
VTDRLGIYSPDQQLRAFLDGGQTIVERLADGQRWRIPNGGRSVSFSPGSAWLAWTVAPAGVPLDTVRREIWISRPDGSQARQVGAVTGGGFSGWVTDTRFLVSGRPDDAPDLQALWIADLPAEAASGQTANLTELARAARLRSTVVSPGGGWVVYLVTFSDDPAQDGLWLASTSGGQARKLDLFGAYRWRDENRLLVIPLEPGAASNRLVQVDADTGQSSPLTDPARTVFKISGGDWSVSPDGRYIVFLSAQDQNLWLLELP